MKTESPHRTRALILGAGPAGAAAAIALRRSGIDVVLVDKEDFPRDKVCGDGLIPDSLCALKRLGLEDAVLASALRLDSVRIYVPNGKYFGFEGEFASLPRMELDRLLHETALEAGVRFLAKRRVEKPIEERGRVRGAVLRAVPGGKSEEIRADITILATGASPGPLERFGVLQRRAPSAVALRGYYEVPDDIARSFQHLVVSYDAAIRPGYGWIFPGPRNVFNVGVGCFHDSRRASVPRDLRVLFDLFVKSFGPAREVVGKSRKLGQSRGAPLRCNISGSRFHRPGLLVVGEAAGTTYSYIGEGIGKAMESGLMAADLIASAFSGEAGSMSDLGERYEAAFRARHGERYRGYRRAQDWLAWPSICNLLAGRAREGSFVTRQLEGMLTESIDAGELFSFRGMARALLG